MAERVDVSRLSVAECMALGGGAGEVAEEEGQENWRSWCRRLGWRSMESAGISTRGWRTQSGPSLLTKSLSVD